MKGSTGGPMSALPDAKINALAEKADQRPATTQRAFIAKDRRKRRYVNFTPGEADGRP